MRNTKAKKVLIARLGDYCSYCERRTPYAIEHILPWGPKNVGTKAAPCMVPQHTRLEDSWTNFLLTCVTCNNFKKERQDATPYNDRRQARRRYYWPDTDNTFRAYEYHPTGDITANPKLTSTEAMRAARTLYIFGFEAYADERKLRRAEIWASAETFLDSWTSDPSEKMLGTIGRYARDAGHWSIWVTVFAAHPQVIERLNKVLPGTARGCFDLGTGAVIARRKGQL